jgi:hypothetical protein
MGQHSRSLVFFTAILSQAKATAEHLILRSTPQFKLTHYRTTTQDRRVSIVPKSCLGEGDPREAAGIHQIVGRLVGGLARRCLAGGCFRAADIKRR